MDHRQHNCSTAESMYATAADIAGPSVLTQARILTCCSTTSLKWENVNECVNKILKDNGTRDNSKLSRCTREMEKWLWPLHVPCCGCDLSPGSPSSASETCFSAACVFRAPVSGGQQCGLFLLSGEEWMDKKLFFGQSEVEIPHGVVLNEEEQSILTQVWTSYVKD